MELKYNCPHCQELIAATPAQIGSTAPCPHCGIVVTVPNPLAGGLPPLPSSRSAKLPGRPGWGLALGLVGLCAWQLPGLGLPVTIVGLVFSANALRRPQKSLAIAATVICGLGLALSAIAAIGEFLANNNGRLLPNPPAVGIIGLQKNELPLSSATIYGHWVEEDVCAAPSARPG